MRKISLLKIAPPSFGVMYCLACLVMGLVRRFSEGKVADCYGLFMSRGLADYIMQFDILRLSAKGEKMGVAGSKAIAFVRGQRFDEYDNERWVRGVVLYSIVVGLVMWCGVVVIEKMVERFKWMRNERE